MRGCKVSDTIYTFTQNVKIHIRHTPGHSFPYDWYTDAGTDSEYRFVTQEEAVLAAENFFS